METKLERIKNLNQEICEGLLADTYFCRTKKSKELYREYYSLIIECNTLNNVYYNYDKWIYYYYETAVNSAKGLSGNDLTNYVANELNKLNGILLERKIENGKVNYYVDVITPYTIYHYMLYRGYNGNVNLSPFKFSDGTNKSKTATCLVQNHICEIAYADNPSLEELRTNCNRDIIDKQLKKLQKEM